jgi:hypothetical protein
MSGTSKKVWLGIRMLRNELLDNTLSVDMLDVLSVSEPSSDSDALAQATSELQNITTNYTV